MNKIEFVKKRSGEIALFEKNKIVMAICQAFITSEEGNKLIAQKLTETILEDITRVYFDEIPTVEEIQDFIESTLIENNYTKTAKNYIIYRNKRALIRDKKNQIA